MTYLKASGVDLSKYIRKMKTDHESIWNTKAGRTLSADFVGRIVGYKWKITINARALNQHESAIIHKALRKGDFIDIEFIPTNSETDELVTAKMYVSTVSNTVYSHANGLPRYEAMSFNLIEQ